MLIADWRIDPRQRIVLKFQIPDSKRARWETEEEADSRFQVAHMALCVLGVERGRRTGEFPEGVNEGADYKISMITVSGRNGAMTITHRYCL